MKITVLITLASILLISACASVPKDRAGGQAPMAAASASSDYIYQCYSGETIAASYPSTDSARIQYMGNTHDMKLAVSASGARYLGDELEWWTKGTGSGSEGTLLQHMPDGTSGVIIENCSVL